MARYTYGWIECKRVDPLSREMAWSAVIDIQHLLHGIKDYDGFACLFGTEDSWIHEEANRVSRELQKALGGSGEGHPFPFLPVVPQRAFPEDASDTVKVVYDPSMECIASFMPPSCDAITITPTKWIGWREIKKADWEAMDKPPAYPLPEIHRNEQGEEVYRVWVKRISRHFASWVNARELAQVDWEEEQEWIDHHIYQYRRNEQGELVQLPFGASIWEVKRHIGDVEIDFSREQMWDAGDSIYRIEKIKMRRKQMVENWTQVFEVVRMLAEKYGDENVRIIAWLD